MRFTGKTHDFLADVLPDEDFRADIFSLVESAWKRVKLPRSIKFEPRITGLLQMAMVAQHEADYQDDPPFDIREDVKIRNRVSGKETERMDLGVWLRQRYITGAKPYFVFESKKLNIVRVGVPDSNVHDYVGDEGMGHLLTGGYHAARNRCGMLAYVMDGNVTTAKRSVEKQLGNKCEELRLRGEAKIHPSKLMPAGSAHGETYHTNGMEKTVIFHLFLPVVLKR